jgi:hypothetical protein
MAAPRARTRPPKDMAVPEAPPASGAAVLELLALALAEEPLDDASEASGVEEEMVTAAVPVAVAVELPPTTGMEAAPLVTGIGTPVAMTELTRTAVEVAMRVAVEVTVMFLVSNVT